MNEDEIREWRRSIRIGFFKEDTDNPIHSFTLECGCKIMGKAPIVDKISLCTRHRSMFGTMKEYAPFTSKKVLAWWEESSRR